MTILYGFFACNRKGAEQLQIYYIKAVLYDGKNRIKYPGREIEK